MRYIVFFASIFLAMAWASVSVAQIPGIGGDLGITPGMQETIDMQGGSTATIGSPTNPVGIYLDPNAGPWQKRLAAFQLGVPLTINEVIQIGAAPNSNPPGPPWTDWDEQIMDAGWSWAAAPAPIAVLSDDGNVAGVIKTKVNINDFVEFDFNPPENPGVNLNITKTLVWIGPGPERM